MSFSRTLTFRTDTSVTGPVTLMLTFDKIQATPTLNQVAWRVLNFGGPGQFATASYVQNLMFASVQVNDGNIVTAVADQVIGIGQETSLVPSGQGVIFTTPVQGPAGELTAINQTGTSQGLAVGFIGSNGFPNPLLVWQNVGNTNSVQAVFTPILSVYATAQYQQTQLITGEIVSPVLLNTNLATLPTQQVYTLYQNPDGSYTIKPDLVAESQVKPKAKFDPGFDDYLIGTDGAISVTNNLSSIIQVKVTNTTNTSGSEAFYQVDPGLTESWRRGGAEIVAVNVGGHGRVANYYGIVGKNLQINRA